jgi:hypothetical protein
MPQKRPPLLLALLVRGTIVPKPTKLADVLRQPWRWSRKLGVELGGVFALFLAASCAVFALGIFLLFLVY